MSISEPTALDGFEPIGIFNKKLYFTSLTRNDGPSLDLRPNLT